MQQVLQPIDGAATEVAEIPAPVCGPGEILVANRCSLISAGTERGTVQLAKTSLLQKAKQRPDHVRRALDKVRQEGFANTFRQVREKLAQPMTLGYSSAGVVVEVGAEVRDFRVGDRAASNGPHAGVVAVPRHLAALVPAGVPFDRACYAVVAAIALQGVRLARVGLGDRVAVIGLGLIGQLSVALLKSAGCVVFATDLDARKLDLAREMGADSAAGPEEFEGLVAEATGGHGADAVVIAAATASNAPLEAAARIARAKGRIVAVGSVGMAIPRRDFYPKELEFVVSCSYGPGRYDPEYEERGRDYPLPHVRWTEQRNIQAALDLMAAGRLPVERLTTHRFGIDSAAEAYALIESGAPAVGVVLEYAEDAAPAARRLEVAAGAAPIPAGKAGLAVIGAGNFAAATLIPAFAADGGFAFTGLISAHGVTARALAKRRGFRFAATDFNEALADDRTQAVALATRHHLHVPQGLAALHAGKHVFLEKPLAISEAQLDEWLDALDVLGPDAPLWTVGYNRRFSPAVALAKAHFAGVAGPRTATIRFNAGELPAGHWARDPEIGGGRIVGEACHAIDLALHLVGSIPTSVQALGTRRGAAADAREDNAALLLRHADGSVSTILYAAGGDRAAGKERVEIHGGGRSAVVDDFRRVEGWAGGRRTLRKAWWSQQKGYAEEVAAFRNALATGVPPIPYAELIAGARTALRAVQALRSERPVEVA